MSKMIDATRSSPGPAPPRTRLCAFRPATLSDLGPIIAIENRSFPEPWPRSIFIGEMFGRSWSRVTVALRDDAVVGYMVYWTVVGEIHLLNLAVAPEARRTGVGRALMENLVETGRLEKVDEILLEVRRSNLAAQRLYLGFAFQAIAVRPRYYSDNGEDALVMSLHLR